jgi:ubiquinone/menaquinone biosynthesis C-methylase UbiE
MSNTQKDRFLSGEGDAYYARNAAALSAAEIAARHDPVLDLLRRMSSKPSRVLEVGCANGWRLTLLRQLGAVECCGVDPSSAAIEDGSIRDPELHLQVGTADRLPFPDRSFDMLIFGFCLYLCDPHDHFRIVAEADRVLMSPGSLIIFDFDPPLPYRNTYTHVKGVYSYKMDFADLFTSHPAYRTLAKFSEGHGGAAQTPDNSVAATLIRKDSDSAWPNNPWINAK